MLLIEAKTNQKMSTHEHAEVNGTRRMNQRYANKCENEAACVMFSAGRGWSQEHQQANHQPELARHSRVT